MIHKELKVQNRQGIHARPATSIINLLKRFNADVNFVLDEQRADAKSILELLTLAAVKDTILQVEVSGEDSEKAYLALKQLFDDKFGEE